MVGRLGRRRGEVLLWLLPFLLITVVIDRKASTGSGILSAFLAVVVTLAVFAVGYLLWHRPVIYTFLGGLVLSVFSGNWQSMGLPGFPFVPDRILLAGALIMLMLRPETRFHPRELRVRPPHILLALAVLYVVVSAAAAGTLGSRNAIFTLLDRYGAIPFLTFFLAPLFVRTAKDRRLMLATLVLLGLYLGLEGLCEALRANALVLPHYIVNPAVGTVDGRVRGPFTAPVTMGFALFASATAGGVVLATQPVDWLRTLSKFVIPLCLVVSFFTLERGVWIGTVA